MTKAKSKEAGAQLRLADGTIFEIGRVTAISMDIPTIFSIEMMRDGKLRLTYNATRIKSLSEIEGLTILRGTPTTQE